jgi:hypothetical protein
VRRSSGRALQDVGRAVAVAYDGFIVHPRVGSALAAELVVVVVVSVGRE